jgi:hypothetical protein
LISVNPAFSDRQSVCIEDPSFAVATPTASIFQSLSSAVRPPQTRTKQRVISMRCCHPWSQFLLSLVLVSLGNIIGGACWLAGSIGCLLATGKVSPRGLAR